MARAHYVAKARKDNPAVKKGEPYWWWQFYRGSKRYSATRPTRSMLTASEFLSEVYAIEDDMDSELERCQDVTGVETYRDELVGQLETLREQCEESLENMPESLQESSDAGLLLSERIETLQSWEDDLGSIDISEWENTDGLTQPGDIGEAKAEHLEDLKEQIRDAVPADL